MRWFSSFVVTAVLAGLAAGLLWLREHEPLGVAALSDALQWLLPGVVVAAVPVLMIPLLFLTLGLVRALLQRVLAYTESATDASPRGQPGKRAALGAAANHLFHNPTRWWLTPFTLIVGLVVALSGAFVFLVDRDPPTRLVWGLTALYGSTLVATMAVPDRRQPLRAAPDPEPDPVLRIPSEPPDST